MIPDGFYPQSRWSDSCAPIKAASVPARKHRHPFTLKLHHKLGIFTSQTPQTVNEKHCSASHVQSTVFCIFLGCLTLCFIFNTAIF